MCSTHSLHINMSHKPPGKYKYYFIAFAFELCSINLDECRRRSWPQKFISHPITIAQSCSSWKAASYDWSQCVVMSLDKVRQWCGAILTQSDTITHSKVSSSEAEHINILFFGLYWHDSSERWLEPWDAAARAMTVPYYEFYLFIYLLPELTFFQ